MGGTRDSAHSRETSIEFVGCHEKRNDASSVSDITSSELVPQKIDSPYKSEEMLLNCDEEVEQMVP